MTLFIGIDPALIAVSSLAANKRDAEEIIERIVYWSAVARQKDLLRLVQLAYSSEILAQANCFPSGPNIRALLELFDLQYVYSAEDIRRLVNTILDETRS